MARLLGVSVATTNHKMTRVQHLVHGLIAAVALLLLAQPSWMPRAEFGKAIGEAFLIALLVIYLVEVQSHKRLEDSAEAMIRKIGKNIIPLIYGHELPSPLVEALEASTLEQPVYRERLRIDVELQPVDKNRADGTVEKLCRVEATYTYQLVNCSDSQVARPLRMVLERDKWLTEIIANGQVDPAFHYVKIDSVLYVEAHKEAAVRSRLKVPAEAKTKPLGALTGWSKDGNNLEFVEKEFAIPPGGRIEVSFSGTLYKRNSDNEVCASFYPTLGVSLNVSTADFDVEARFPGEDEDISTDVGGLTCRWSYDAPLLAGQSVLFWWRPKKP